jgi:hypothetical protein
MSTLSGPHQVSKQLQIKIPVKIARALHFEPGDGVDWRLSDDDPTVLVLMSAAVVERRYSVGERLERLDQQVGSELPYRNHAADSPQT